MNKEVFWWPCRFCHPIFIFNIDVFDKISGLLSGSFCFSSGSKLLAVIRQKCCRWADCGLSLSRAAIQLTVGLVFHILAGKQLSNLCGPYPLYSISCPYGSCQLPQNLPTASSSHCIAFPNQSSPFFFFYLLSGLNPIGYRDPLCGWILSVVV